MIGSCSTDVIKQNTAVYAPITFEKIVIVIIKSEISQN